MGRGRVEVKRIENKINRQVTFSKRRSGLLKKAREISVLCDADVALFFFSPKGKLSEFTSVPCVEKMFERYEHYSHAEKHLIPHNIDSHGSLTLEHSKIKAKLEILQKKYRHYMGEELDNLSCRELQNVEHQLDISLKHIRSKKNQMMHELVFELRKKDKALVDHNNGLSKKAEEKVKKKKKAIAQWKQQKHDLNSLPPLFVFEALPSLNTRDNRVVEDETTQTENRRNTGTLMPPWMLSHIGHQ